MCVAVGASFPPDKIPIARNRTFAHSLPNHADGLYYIYPWSESFYWRFPLDNATCKSSGLQHYMMENSGIGRSVDSDMGLFETWHHAMFSSLWNRLKRSRRRTQDPSQASLFIIPYDITVDTSYKPNCKQLNPEMKFPLTITMQNVTALLNHSEYFQRYNGADHILLNSFRSFGRNSKKKPTPNFLLDMCKECLKTCFYRYRHHSDRFIPVPYASSFHFHNDIQSLPWASEKKRSILITYVGGWKTDVASSANLRHIIVYSCQKSKVCEVRRLVHQDNALKLYKYPEYRKSTFCLQPPGDDPSRKGVMDSILSGCIPVTFHPDTLLTALPLHLSTAEAREISVYIPEYMALNSTTFDIMKYIESIPSSVVEGKRRKIALLGYQLQYSVPPLQYLQNRSDETPWDPPYPDGVDVMLDGMIAISMKAQVNSSYPLFSYPYNLSSNKELHQKFSSIMW